MARSIADNQAAEQLKTCRRRLACQHAGSGLCLAMACAAAVSWENRDFLSKSALSRQRRFRVAN
jgi:hypothetical protein